MLLAGVVLVAAVVAVGLLLRERLFPPPPSYGFVGDYETGDLSQWDRANSLEGAVPTRIQVVSSPVREGDFAARFEVREGDKVDAGNDVNPGAAGERAEVAQDFNGVVGQGDELFYGISLLLPDDWSQEQAGWRIFLQFHSVNDQLDGRSPVPPLALDIVPPDDRPNGRGDGGLYVETHGGDVTDDRFAEGNVAEILPLPLRTSVWHDFVLQVRWDREDGLVRIWHRISGEDDFELRAELVDVPTLLYVTEPELRISDVFMRQGLYRAANDATNVLYLDATVRGSSFGDVARKLS